VRRLPVDLPALAALFDEARNGPVRSFFDRVTGELDSMPRDAEVEGVYDDILNGPERWVEVVPLPSSERLQLRRRFAEEQLHDIHVHQRLRLADALDAADPAGGPGATRRAMARFEAVLREGSGELAGGNLPVGNLLDRWLAYRAATLAPLARTWLSALGVEPASSGTTPNRAS
jgi:hypothetical protein